jgi:hypothetical protein
VFTKGVVQNVRQGSGADSDLLLADLVVYDQTLISEIQEGKREVSCGYDCIYEPLSSDGPDPDQQSYQQKQICGNHVAVVMSGRAGDRVAIKDSHSTTGEEPKGASKMPKKLALPRKRSSLVTDFMAAIGFKQFATDAEPEEVMDAIEALAGERGPQSTDADNDQEKNNDPPTNDADPILQAIQALNARLDKIEAAQSSATQQPASPEDAIDAAIAELEKTQPAASDDDDPESVTIPAASMDDDGPVSDPEDRPKNPLTGDNAYMIEALKALKPIIAAIPDQAERKRAADAAISAIKKKPKHNAYADISKGQRRGAADNQPAGGSPQKKDHSALGRDIAKKFNPHYKDRA